MRVRSPVSSPLDVLLAGLAGATAEVAWIALYCLSTPLSASVVLREITNSVLPGAAAAGWAPAFGLVVHYLLAIAIAGAYAAVFRRAPARGRSTLAPALASLGAIWAFNFFVLLPVINPAFVTLLPLAVTFASKLLFGLAMAATLDAKAGARAGFANLRTGH